jgi:PRTRC genetic system protein C
MAIVIEHVKRVFKLNDKELDDPNPNMSSEEVQDFYSLQHPEIASAKLVGPTQKEGGVLEYEFKTGIQTKG